MGQVVAYGTPTNLNGQSACNFATIGVTIPALSGHVRSLDLRANSQCQLTVYSKFDNSTNNSPAYSPLSCNQNCYSISVKNDFWMYGYGGTGDKLTETVNTVGFTINPGSYAQIYSSNAYCSWHSGTGWVNDACYDDQVVNQGNPASYEFQGNFHWSINNGYYHELHNQIRAYDDGSSQCGYYWSGSIVAGVTNTCTKS